MRKFGQKISVEILEKYIRGKEFLSWFLQDLNNFAQINKLQKGSELHAVRVTLKPFNSIEGGFTATGKQRSQVLASYFSEEISEMREELTQHQD